MALTKRTYVDGETIITAQNLNDIQDEVRGNIRNVSYDSTSGKIKKTTNSGTSSDVLTVDSTPTQNSKNPVQSGGVYTAIGNISNLPSGSTDLVDAVNDLNGAISNNATKTMLPVNPCLRESKLIAHQGSTSFVQSTDLCFKNAIMQGFKILEGDVQKTSDNKFVIWHDSTVGGLTVASSTLAQIQALTLDYGCKVMTLQEFLKLCIQNGVVAELDLTVSHFSDANFNTYKQDLYDIVKSINPTLDSVIWTANYQKLMYMQQVDPSVIICYSGLASIDSVGPNVEMISRNSRFIMFSMNNAQIDQDIINWAHNNGYYIKTYTIDTETKLFNTFANGADYAIVESILPAIDKYSVVGGISLMQNWVYDGRITLTNDGVANGVRLVNNNMLHIMLHGTMAKNLTANQTSVLTLPSCFTPIYPNPGIALVGDNAGALNTPFLASVTQNSYLNITHGGALVTGKHIVVSMYVIIPPITSTFPSLS